jgi:hypothetical protein|tara:strand:- start:278 stop:970 length:693 start_codon:yes stop_codon:yes gene_type:complete
MTLYCPSKDDWSVEYGNAVLRDDGSSSGWVIHGGGRVASTAAFNLLGGYIEFDMNTTHANTNVNNNFYLTSPDRSTFPKYCDIQQTPGCLEMDIVENNGNCVAATTWHTENGHVGKGNCDRGGCAGSTKIPKTGEPFRIKASFKTDGEMRVTLNGVEIQVHSPTPNGDAVAYVKETFTASGAMVHSSQWTGWVPGGDCSGGGGLDASTFSVANVKVMAAGIVQGREPRRC